MSDGFLSRWSRKKLESRDDGAENRRAQVERAPESEAREDAGKAAAMPSAAIASPQEAPVAVPEEAPSPSTELPPIESLTPESDFRPFLKPDVDPTLKNQAMKALFKDPHFNIMDGLDIYIDDYSKPDPLPESMLRQLNQSKMLKLFEEEEKEAETPAVAENPPAETDTLLAENVGQNDATETKCPILAPTVETETHQPHKQPD